MARGPIVNSPFICFSNIRGRRVSLLISSLCEMLNLQMSRIAALPRAALGLGQPMSPGGEVPTAPPLLSQLRSFQVRLPGLLPKQGLPGFLRVGWGKADASNLASISHPPLAFHLPKLCEHLLRGEQYKCKEMSFRMQSVAENLARIVLDHMSITLRLHELEYLVLNLTTLANQMAWYRLAEADVSAYVQIAVRAATFVPPKESSCLYV